MPEVNSSKFFVTAGWNDVPHIDEQTKAELLENTPAHLRKARSEGEPSMGAGAIYPFEEEEISCPPFQIPAHFARGYGLDVGWNKTAAIFGAWDRDTDVIYVYSEHYRGQAEPSVHADAIKARGDWLIGAIDPAARTSSQKDGENLLASYRNLQLNLAKADNAVEAGLLECLQRFSSGRLKIFTTCRNLLAERKIYRRDENGKIVKKFDHALDAMRYLVMTRKVMRTKPVASRNNDAFLVADSAAGY